MFLSIIELQPCHQTFDLLSNRYHLHQRISEACPADPRLLFRIEDLTHGPSLIVQSHLEPVWEYACGDLKQAVAKWQVEFFEPEIQAGARYRFRLLANPTYKKEGKRWGIRNERELVEWLNRKLSISGASLIACSVRRAEFVRSFKDKEPERKQQHWGVWFIGDLRADDAECLRRAVENGIGPAKGYGFGLLSLLSTNGPSEEFSPHAWG